MSATTTCNITAFENITPNENPSPLCASRSRRAELPRYTRVSSRFLPARRRHPKQTTFEVPWTVRSVKTPARSLHRNVN
jgi:hypothetical protein